MCSKFQFRYVDELDSVDDTERYEAPPLLTLLEEQRGGMGADERVSISMISICPSTGDVVYDEFDGQSLGSGACATYLLREFQTQACVLNSKWVECCRLITWEFN